MSIIKVLPDHLISQIAAGEVIERPASVIKELVENSLDSGAKNIHISIQNAGKSYIEVTDDGQGIPKSQIKLAITRHATSKLSTQDDLWSINTLGFRGEALASIASISKLEISSKTPTDQQASKITSSGSHSSDIEPTSLNQGTKIIVKDLFFNTPARKKYLKTNQTERSKIAQIITEFVLANPQIQFTFQTDKSTKNYPSVQSLHERLLQVFGPEVAGSFLPIFYQSQDLKISGYIGKPLVSRTTSQHQYFFVNKRSIRHNLLAHRIKAAYSSMLMEHKKPIFAINIDINPNLIDVNVHPRKLELRFQNESELVKILYNATKKALTKDIIIPKVFTESKTYMSDTFPKSTYVKQPSQTYKPSSSIPTPPKPQTLSFQPAFQAPQTPNTNQNQSQYTAIAQLEKRYIIAKDQHGLVLVDQHAAHERVRYEQLMEEFHRKDQPSQTLLVPQQIQLTTSEQNLVEENLALFAELGFELKPFGGSTYTLYSLPNSLDQQDHTELIKDLIDDLLNHQKPSTMQGKTHSILTYIACRTAVKFGDYLHLEEMQSILDRLQKTEKPSTCPHGRPTMISFSLDELEKKFGRKK